MRQSDGKPMTGGYFEDIEVGNSRKASVTRPVPWRPSCRVVNA
jgi:hypothetical protein